MIRDRKNRSPIKRTTLDNDYSRQAKLFSNEHKQLPIKKKKLKQLMSQHEINSQKPMANMTTDEINSYYKEKNEITELQKEINNIENLTDVTDFYLKTGGLLINYYDNIDTDQSQRKRGRPAKNKKPEVQQSEPIATMLTYFKSNNHINEKTSENNDTSQTSKSIEMVGVDTTLQRADIYDQYLSFTDPHHILNIQYNRDEDLCLICNEFRELIASEAIFVCPKCGDEVQTVMESDKPSYKDPPHENMYFAYKRINHFKEQLSHFQAKETTKIPNEVYDVILIEFKKEKNKNLANLTRSKVKGYLQKYTNLGYNKYYENINQIICHLNGVQPLSMLPEVEEQLCNMFLKIQEPFIKHCPSDRTNFLSYSYVIHKFCQLLGYHEYLPYFNLLKSKDKLHDQDVIWKKICQDLAWKYYPSSH